MGVYATVYAWGDNSDGQLGNGSTGGSSVPVPVTLPAGVTPTAVSEGYRTSLALGSDGNVYAWGYNQFGQLGDGSTNDAQTPVRVSLPGGVAAVAVSEGFDTSLALGSNGTVYAWGSNLAGQLGDGTATGPSMCGSTPCGPTPAAVSLPRGVRAIAIAEGGDDTSGDDTSGDDTSGDDTSGDDTSLALGSNGRVYAWGDNSSGQLGDGTTTGPGTCAGTACSVTPVAVSLPRGVLATAVSAGGATSLALGWDGQVYAWGDNSSGQLGNGSITSSPTPVRVLLPDGVLARKISAGGATSLALGWDGRVYGWGDNSSGQLGNGSTTSSSTPVRVSLPSGVRALAVSAGGSTSLALGSNHSVYAWGDNESGQLGNGSMAGSSTPVQASLPGQTTATAVSEGSGTSLAIAVGRTAPAVATTTTLTASPNPAAAGATVTLTAAVVAADGTNPAGSVQFQAGGTGVGSPVAVTSGSASTTATFSAAGTVALSATFTPASTKYAVSTDSLSLTVTAAGSSGGGEPITVTVPSSGVFTVSVAPGTVPLTASGQDATGTLQDVTVSDTRNDDPGWSASGQESDFAGSGTAGGSAIPGDQLGWTPAAVGSLQGGATVGPPVAPAAPGLGTSASVLALAGAGDGAGTNVLTANVDLLIPDGQQPGMYTGSLTITYVESAP